MNLSIIVTTYNNPSALRKVLEGLLSQKKAPYEVIVADDGSAGDTARAVKDSSLKAPFPLVHVWQENRGFRAAKIRNEAIKRATGEYLVIMDGDCIPGRNFVSDHMALAEPGFFFQGKRILLGEKVSASFGVRHANSLLSFLRLVLSSPASVSNTHHLIRIPFFPAFKNRKLKGIKSCNMGFFKCDILAVNGFNEDFTGWGREDSELAVRFYKYGLRRKSHLFMAACYHLWHPHYPVDTLKENDAILKNTIAKRDFFCANGIVKK